MQRVGIRKAILTGSAALVLAVALSGCVVIQQITESQTGVGLINVTISFCFSSEDGQAARPLCRELGNPGVGDTANDGASGSPGSAADDQLLFGFRLPAGAVAPPTLTIAEAPQVSVTQSTSYGAALQALKPASVGQRWVGYRASAPLATSAEVSAGTQPAAYTLRASFGATGSPFRY